MANQQQRAHMHDLAWAAGLFEGEGGFSVHRPARSPRHRRLVAYLQMTDEDVVRTFAAVVGVGNVTTRQPPAPRKRAWVWQAGGDDVRLVYAMLEPWLHERRRKQFAKASAERAIYELERVA